MVAAIATFTTGRIEQEPTRLITIGGTPTPADTFTTRHGVNQPAGSVGITVPVEGDTSHIAINATVEVHAGYRTTATHRVFLGRITDIKRHAGTDGVTLRVQAQDETARLDARTEEELTFTGATTLTAIARSLMNRRAVQLYEVDRILSPNGATEIAFGGVAEIDDGNVVLSRRTGLTTWLAGKVKLFGYRLYGTPAGPTRVSRVSGLPTAPPVATFREGVDLFEIDRDESNRPMVTNWTVYGARYTDKDGVPIEIRSIPSVVPPAPELDPPGYRSGDESDSILVTQSLVNAVRQVMEIDHSAVHEELTWTTWGRPEIQPGDVIAVRADAVGATTTRTFWVMSVQHTWSRQGFTTTLTGWRGAGSPLAAGIDETTINIGSGVYRLGDEYLPHYVVPAGGGREEIVIPFTVPSTYTSLALVGRQHGTNSYLLDGVNTDATVSKLEVWQGGERVGSAQLPMSPENLAQALDYTNRSNWSEFRMPIPGRLETGGAELKIIAGRDSRISDVFALDDFEIENLGIEVRGFGSPILPGAR